MYDANFIYSNLLDFGLSRIEEAIPSASLPYSKLPSSSQAPIPPFGFQLDPVQPIIPIPITITHSPPLLTSNQSSSTTPLVIAAKEITSIPPSQNGYAKLFNNLVSSISSISSTISNLGNTAVQPNSPSQSTQPTQSSQPKQHNDSQQQKNGYITYEGLSTDDYSHKATVAYVIYAAPEVLTGKRYSSVFLYISFVCMLIEADRYKLPCDVFSFGYILYELVCDKHLLFIYLYIC